MAMASAIDFKEDKAINARSNFSILFRSDNLGQI